MKLSYFKNYNLLTFKTLDSTNSEALRFVSKGASGNFIILTDKQTGGRGQKQKKWISIDGNLHASILLDSDTDPKKHPQLSFIIANTMHESISELARKYKLSLDIKLKWPNDILINNKKVSGILLESINFQNKNYVVIGFGVNIVASPLSLKDSTTSLLDENIKLKDSNEFLSILMNKFDRLYNCWKFDNNFIKTKKYWMKHAYNLNKTITIDNGVDRICGIFKEINEDGSMKLQLASGEFYNLTAGEVLIHKKIK